MFSTGARRGWRDARDHWADGLDKLTMAIGTNYNRAEGQYYINTQKLYREGPTQRTVLWLEWALRRWKAQFDSSYWSRTARLMANKCWQCLQDSRATAIIWMRIEWELESSSNSTTIISLSRKWNFFSTYGKVRPGNAYSVSVINLLAARRGDQSLLKCEATWAFLTGMEQPPAISPTSPTREERES